MASLAFKVLGVIGLASYAAAYVCVKVRRVSYNRFKLIAVPAEALPDMPRGYSFRALDHSELAQFTIDISPEVQAQRFASGLECLAIFDRKDALVGVCWLGRRVHEEGHLHVRFVLPANAAWDTGLWVPEDKRMSRAFSATWAAIKHWLHKEGLEWTLSSIADYNIPSILSHRRLGSRDLGHVTVLRVGSFQITIGARPLLSVRGRSPMPTRYLRATP